VNQLRQLEHPMRLPRQYPWILATLLACATAAPAQQAGFHIGYVYPAGGKQGTTFEAVVAGQFLTGAQGVQVSGGGIEGQIVELVQPISSKELNQLRIEIDELLARKAVVSGDFRTLERFRSFKNAKTAKQEGDEDDELAELKKKYAGATWTADDEKRLGEVRRKMSSGVRRPANPAISELAIVRFTLAPDAEPGRRELRLQTAAGLSNPLAFEVGRLTEFSEEPSRTVAEQRSSIERSGVAVKNLAPKESMTVTLPAVINGQILPGGVDRFSFAAKKGQRLVIVAHARDLIPYIADAVPGWFQATLAVYDSQGRELAYDDDYQFNPDPVLRCQIPADGQYTVEIKDAIYRGREDFVYRVMIGELPFIASVFPLGGPAGVKTAVELTGWNLPSRSLLVEAGSQSGVQPVSVRSRALLSNTVSFAVDSLPETLEQEPNDQPAAAQKVELPMIVNGRIDRADDVDVFQFAGRAEGELVVEVTARRLGSPLDSTIELTDSAGKSLGLNDDCEDKGSGLLTHHADSQLIVKLPADGTYFVRLTDGQHQGGPEYAYRVRLSPPRPDFELRAAPSTLNLRAGQSGVLSVYAVRKDGFAGEITLDLKGPPGFTLAGGRIPAGQDAVRVTLAPAKTSGEASATVELEGRASVDGREIARRVVPAEDMMQAFAYRHLVPVDELRVAVLGNSGMRTPVTIASPLPVKIPAGGTARVEIAASQGPLVRMIQLQLSEPPEGIALENVAPSRRGVEVVLAADAQVKPGLAGNLILTASAKGTGAGGNSKAAAGRGRAPLATLPAVPFEIVAP
jgi:hypothetical protein